jgi:trk system potassium uptake protein TrkA
MNIIIVGGGRVGQRLAELLLPYHRVVVIEKDKEQGEKLADMVDVLVIIGDGGSLETLENAGIADGDVLVAVTGDDKINLVACELAKNYKIKRVIARIKDKRDEAVFEELGVSDAILESDVLARIISYSILGIQDTSLFNFINKLIPIKRKKEKLIWMPIEESSPALDKFIKDLKLPKKCNIASIIRNYNLIMPEKDTRIEEGDLVLVVADEKFLPKISRIFV